MLLYLFFIFIFLNSVLFLNLNHPLTMGLILMTQTFLISISSGLMTKTFWFSYSLFLIFMGGMLILIMYMTSLAYNELFSMFKNKMKILLSLFVLFFLINLFFMKNMNFINFSNFENQPFFSLNFFLKENNLMINKMFNFPTNMLMILLVTYMFFTLILSVKITNIFKGPIRSK